MEFPALNELGFGFARIVIALRKLNHIWVFTFHIFMNKLSQHFSNSSHLHNLIFRESAFEYLCARISAKEMNNGERMAQS